MVRRRVLIRGLVQGVAFRAACRREAQRAAVSGWVCNRPDGAVEAVFEGDEEAVAAMVRWSHDGPPSARVEKVDVVDEEPLGEVGFGVG